MMKKAWFALMVKKIDDTIERLMFHAEVEQRGSVVGRLRLNGKLVDWSCLPGELLPLTDDERAEVATIRRAW